MSRTIGFSRTYPAYHPKAGQPTYFVEKVLKSLGRETDRPDLIPKGHTIRAGKRWKPGMKFTPRYWTGSPYNYKRDGSKHLPFAPDIEVVKTWAFEVTKEGYFLEGERLGLYQLEEIAKNDGLLVNDLELWFNKPINGQIICWNEEIDYTHIINCPFSA